ncbi:MAG: asparagine synthase-related protein, partial [Salinirussus sp.]
DIEVDGTSTETTGTATFRRYHDEIGDLLPPERRDALARMQAVDVMYPLPDQILHKVDTASMYNSLEVRTPLLDRSVVEYAMSLPTAYKIDRAEQKRVLKGALGDRLPPAIRRREKSGFDMPLGHWFRNELADEFRELLRQTETDLLDERSIRRTFERHVSGRQAAGKFLWAVYVFCQWYDRMQRLDVL